MKRRLLAGIGIALPLWGSALAAGIHEPCPTAPASAATLEDESGGALERIVVIGASMSSGFGLRSDLGAALRASLVTPQSLESSASELFFTSPRHFGGQALEVALEGEATLVLALDYLFWFGYGALNASGGPLASEDERLELLEVGLQFLDEIECPLVVADFPDMSAAVGKMLAASQMPAPETLVRLSARVREWAAEREQTLVLPLAQAVVALKGSGELRLGRHVWPAGTRLLQRDELHPNVEGQLGVAQWVADAVVRAGWAREQDFLFDLDAVRGRLR